jgi:cardiolipin synthase
VTTGEVFALVIVVVDIVFRLVALVVVPRNRRPQTAMAWLLAIFFIPILAFLAFLVFGSNRLSARRMAKQVSIGNYLESRHRGIPPGVRVTPDELSVASMPETVRLIAPLVGLGEKLGQMPMLRGNAVELLTDYQASIDQMVQDIKNARQSVHVQFYIMSVDLVTEPFFEALAQARSRGVAVRVIYDQLATARIPGYGKLKKTLREIGVEFKEALPVQPWRGIYQRPDLRNHRKIVVVDSRVAYTGSQNIIHPGYHRRNQSKGLRWLELMIRVQGPLVDSLEALFVTDWFHETDVIVSTPRALETCTGENTFGQLIPSGPAFEGENNLRLFNGLMYAARQRIRIVSPYLVPDDSMRYAITSAALRGVEVDVFVSAVSDQPLVFYAQRSYYEELLEAGVRIWLYPGPTVLHSKFIVVDDLVAVAGTSNLDMRSFTLNLELSVLLIGSEVLSDLTSLAEDYKAASAELTLEQWRARSQRTRFAEGLARLTATVQ